MGKSDYVDFLENVIIDFSYIFTVVGRAGDPSGNVD